MIPEINNNSQSEPFIDKNYNNNNNNTHSNNNFKIITLKDLAKSVLKNNGNHTKRNMFIVAGVLLAIGAAFVAGAVIAAAVVLPPLAVTVATISIAGAAAAGVSFIGGGLGLICVASLVALVHHIIKNRRVRSELQFSDKKIAFESANQAEQQAAWKSLVDFRFNPNLSPEVKEYHKKAFEKFGMYSANVEDANYEQLSNEEKEYKHKIHHEYLNNPDLSIEARVYYFNILINYPAK